MAALPHSNQASTLGSRAVPRMFNQVVAVARAPSRSASGCWMRCQGSHTPWLAPLRRPRAVALVQPCLALWRSRSSTGMHSSLSLVPDPVKSLWLVGGMNTSDQM